MGIQGACAAVQSAAMVHFWFCGCHHHSLLYIDVNANAPGIVSSRILCGSAWCVVC